MKKIFTLASVLVLSLNNYSAQTTIFQDSFDTYTDFAITGVGNWTLRDIDLQLTYNFQGVNYPNSGVVKSFQVFNSTATSPALNPTTTSNWTARTGTKMMVAIASVSSPWNNDWLISPQIQLTASGNALSFWAKSCDATYGDEKFTVYVSTTDTNTASFTAISANPVSSPADVTWHEYTYNLDAYAGQNVYIAIRCTSQDQFGFAVDDFKVVGNSALSTSEIKKDAEIRVSPNPATDYLIINSEEKIKNVNVYDLSGKKVNTDWSGNKVDIRNLQSGSYLLNIETDAKTYTEKFIKK